MKNSYRSIIILLVLSSFSFLSFAQRNYSDILKDAEESMADEDYNGALPLYLQLDSIERNNPQVSYKIGICYLNSTISNKSRALPYLEKALSSYTQNAKKSGINYEIYYFLGRASHLSNKFDEAISYYQEYLSSIEKEAPEDPRVKDTERQIEMCNNAKELIKKPVEIQITNLGPFVNSSYPEYSAVISTDESMIVFTSRRPGSTGNKKDKFGKYFEDIYVSYKIDGEWTSPAGIDTSINSSDHEASVALSVDGQQLIIYKDDNAEGNLYFCDLYGDKWSKPMSMGPNVNTKFWETHASISADGNVLYFVSNKPGGQGGRDIYRSTKLPNGTWGPSQNLGPAVNTSYDEDATFIHPDGKTLYFSSTGHNSMGGFDIFKTTLSDDGTTWSKPENVGYPINSADDDVFYVLSADGKHAYYSSIQDGGYGDKDIYVISLISGKKEVVTMLKGTITVDGKGPIPPDAQIIVTDNQTGSIVSYSKPNLKTGKFIVTLAPGKNYNIVVESSGYLFHSENIFIPDQKTYQEVYKTIQLSPIKAGARVVLKNIFYDYDKATLRPESQVELDRLYKIVANNPSIIIEISGHTDSDGNDEYNQTLSESRAQSVVDYLKSKGIDSKRIIARGYGETRPIASNATDEGKQENRRTEFKIISY